MSARSSSYPPRRAAIRLKVEKASGEWQERVDESREKAHRSRAAKLEERRGEDGKAKETSHPPRGGQLAKTSPAAAAVAEAAGVSPRTVERVQKLERENPEAVERLASARPRARIPR